MIKVAMVAENQGGYDRRVSMWLWQKSIHHLLSAMKGCHEITKLQAMQQKASNRDETRRFHYH
jgi:hypothetical protein